MSAQAPGRSGPTATDRLPRASKRKSRAKISASRARRMEETDNKDDEDLTLVNDDIDSADEGFRLNKKSKNTNQNNERSRSHKQEEYTIEAIKAIRWAKDYAPDAPSYQIAVKWNGYDDITWENLETLGNYRLILEIILANVGPKAQVRKDGQLVVVFINLPVHNQQGKDELEGTIAILSPHPSNGQSHKVRNDDDAQEQGTTSSIPMPNPLQQTNENGVTQESGLDSRILNSHDATMVDVGSIQLQQLNKEDDFNEESVSASQEEMGQGSVTDVDTQRQEEDFIAQEKAMIAQNKGVATHNEGAVSKEKEVITLEKRGLTDGAVSDSASKTAPTSVCVQDPKVQVPAQEEEGITKDFVPDNQHHNSASHNSVTNVNAQNPEKQVVTPELEVTTQEAVHDRQHSDDASQASISAPHHLEQDSVSQVKGIAEDARVISDNQHTDNTRQNSATVVEASTYVEQEAVCQPNGVGEGDTDHQPGNTGQNPAAQVDNPQSSSVPGEADATTQAVVETQHANG